MNISEYTDLLNKPETVSTGQHDALEEIVRQFPYFQSARALQLKGLYNQESFHYNQALKVTAAYTTDRSVLFDFITSDTFTAIQKGLYEQKLAELLGIEVHDTEIISYESTPKLDKAEQSILISIRESAIPYEIETKHSEDEPAQVEQEISTKVHSPEIDSIENAEAKLEIGKPLTFSSSEVHSFGEWLQLSSLKLINRVETAPVQVVEDEGKTKKKQLIDDFIKSNPKIPPVKSDTRTTVPPKAESEDHSALMTETLARVYLEQRKYQKAIQAYEILILKYPEKITFFADRISEIKTLQQNNTN